MILYQVDLGYAVAGIEVEDDVIVDAAPILKWAIGARLPWFRKWVEQKGGTLRPAPGQKRESRREQVSSVFSVQERSNR